MINITLILLISFGIFIFIGLVEDQGFLDQLKELLSDSNPMVVANAVAALSEINESSPTGQPLVGELIYLSDVHTELKITICFKFMYNRVFKSSIM